MFTLPLEELTWLLCPLQRCVVLSIWETIMLAILNWGILLPYQTGMDLGSLITSNDTDSRTGILKVQPTPVEVPWTTYLPQDWWLPTPSTFPALTCIYLLHGYYVSYILHSLPGLIMFLVPEINFYTQYFTRPHLGRHPGTRTESLNDCVLQAEKKTEEHGLSFQTHLNPAHLLQYQTSQDELIALQQCAQTDSGHTLTDNVNHQTSVASMWH